MQGDPDGSMRRTNEEGARRVAEACLRAAAEVGLTKEDLGTIVGRHRTSLERSGHLDNTIVILWGDHGFHLGDHGMWGKHTNYESAVRSPWVSAAATKTHQRRLS